MQRRFLAPGRVNLIGEHTDATGGFVLPVAIDLGVHITVNASRRITLVSGSETVDVAGDGSEDGWGWGAYVSAVAAELAELGRPAVGVTGIVEADLPRGAGLGSSAALEVAVALALCAVAEFELDLRELARACRRAELRAVGVPCGILDQAASLLSRAGHALLLDSDTLEYRQLPLPDGLGIVVIDSGDVHDLARSAYAQRLEELRGALSLLSDRRPRDIALRDLPESADDVSVRRLRHVVTENERVRAVVDALERDDLRALGPLFAASQESLRVDYEVSTPALNRLVALAHEEGALAARLTGGGFGGSIVALVQREHREPFLARALERAGPPARGWTVEPSNGAREL
jgi:galactokinase